jgi:hypothetical protein
MGTVTGARGGVVSGYAYLRIPFGYGEDAMARLESVRVASGWVLILGYMADADASPTLELRVPEARLSPALLRAIEGLLTGWDRERPAAPAEPRVLAFSAALRLLPDAPDSPPSVSDAMASRPTTGPDAARVPVPAA